MPIRPGPENRDTSADLLPPRTVGPFGLNDAGSHARHGELGDTRGPCGVNDRAAGLAGGMTSVPARLFAGTVMGADGGRLRKFKVQANLKIDVPEAQVKRFVHTENVNTGGWFKRHKTYSSDVEDKDPSVAVTFDEVLQQYEVTSITIFTLKILHNPNPDALPRPGENVTNDKALRVRTPPRDPIGKGYWKDVVANMQKYEKFEDEGDVGRLEWAAPESAAFHENVHYEQFKAWVASQNDALLLQMERDVNERLDERSLRDLTVESVARSVRIAIKNAIENGVPTPNEKEAYKKTYDAKWKPVIESITKYARDKGWD